MAYSNTTYTGNGATTDFAVPFPYLLKAHVQASVNSVPTAFTWVSAGVLRISPAPAVGATVVLARNSNRTARITEFTNSASLDEATLDKDSDQLMFVAQEAFDQAGTQSYFTADANGDRVRNVADPVLATDAVNKQFLTAFVSALPGSGSDIRPLNNVSATAFTGNNEFTGFLKVKGASFTGDNVATKDILDLNKGLAIFNLTNNAAQIGYGHATQVRRSTGYGLIVGAQLDAIGLDTYEGFVFGTAIEAIHMKGAKGHGVGLESSVVNLNSNPTKYAKIALDLVFKNREDFATTGGDVSGGFGIAGDGTGGNSYNMNTWAIQLSSQTRSDAGATYVGWNRGFRLTDGWGDVAKASAYDNALPYSPGDYVVSGGHVFICTERTTAGTVTSNTAFWSDLGVGTERGAIAIDLSSYGATTASRMVAALKLRGGAKMLWDTEEHISSRFDYVNGIWKLDNDAAQRFGVAVSTGDILINGALRVLGTQSAVSAHRNLAGQALSAGLWTQVAMTTEEYDSRNEFNPGSGIFTATVAGYHDVTWQLQTDGGSTTGGTLYAGVYKNGVLYRANSVVCTATKSDTALVVCRPLLNVGDTIATYGYSPSSTCNITGEPGGTYLFISKRS